MSRDLQIMKLVAAHVHTPNLLLLRGISSQHIHHELSHCPSSNLWSVDLTFTSGFNVEFLTILKPFKLMD